MSIRLRALQQRQISPPKRPAIKVEAGDRWAVVGTSGTGKTTFSLHLLHDLQQVYAVPLYIINSKPDMSVSQIGNAIKSEEPPDLVERGVQLWEPLDDNPQAFHTYLENIRRRGKPAIVYVDELALMCDKQGNAPLGFTRLLKVGRSLRITTITATQRLAKVPSDVIGQARHVIAFRVQNKYDKQLLNEAIAVGDYAIPHKHGMYYRNLDSMPRGVYYHSSKLFFT